MKCMGNCSIKYIKYVIYIFVQGLTSEDIDIYLNESLFSNATGNLILFVEICFSQLVH